MTRGDTVFKRSLSPPKTDPRKRVVLFLGGERAQALRPVRGDEKGRACKARPGSRSLAQRGEVTESPSLLWLRSVPILAAIVLASR